MRNHLRSVHAIAMVNLGEMATGLALNSGLPAGARSILLSIKVDFTKKARGLLTASCECALPQDNSKQDMSLKAEIRDADSEVVASLHGSLAGGSMSANSSQLQQLLGIETPIICGAMYPCSNPQLVAAASEAGGWHWYCATSEFDLCPRLRFSRRAALYSPAN